MTPYDETFYRKQVRKDRQESYKALADMVATLDPSYVIDYGCGAGWMLYYLWDMGIDVMGFEPSKQTARCAMNLDIAEYIREDPIDVKMNHDIQCDVATCFEVLEHIPEERAQTAIGNICRYTDTVIFSAATQGQGGIGHINEQGKEYWIDMFSKEDFKIDELTTRKMAGFLLDRKAKLWYSKNLMVFRGVE